MTEDPRFKALDELLPSGRTVSEEVISAIAGYYPVCWDYPIFIIWTFVEYRTRIWHEE